MSATEMILGEAAVQLDIRSWAVTHSIVYRTAKKEIYQGQSDIVRTTTDQFGRSASPLCQISISLYCQAGLCEEQKLCLLFMKAYTFSLFKAPN